MERLHLIQINEVLLSSKGAFMARGQSAIVGLLPRLVNCCASDWIDPANDC